MATLVLGGIGAAIGSSIGGPAGARWGWSIGSVVGSWVDAANNAPNIEYGKLSDLKYSGSQFGVAVPRGWGKFRVGAQIIWIQTDGAGNHLVQHSRSVGGGGGGSGGGGGGGTQYWYSATFALGFCTGELTFPDGSSVMRNPVVKRIWADDVLIYDDGSSDNVVTPTFYDGSETQSPDSTIVAALGVGSGHAEAFRGLCYAVFLDMSLEDFGNRIPNFSAEIWTDAVTVGDIYSDLARSAGVLASEIDVTEATDAVTGFVEISRATPQESVGPLLTAYSYDQVEVDATLKLVKRGGASVVTIDPDHVGASTVSEHVPAFQRKRSMVSELPGRIDVQYFDIQADMQQYTQSEVVQTADFTNSRTLPLPLTLYADQAKQIASREIDRAWTETDAFLGVPLLTRYLWLAPGDVVTFPTDTGAVRLRVTKTTMPPLGEVVIEGVLDSDEVVTQATVGDGGSGSTDPYVPIPTTFVAWSGKELRDEDQPAAGFYVAATGDDGWGGAVVWYSLDAGSTWTQGPPISGRSVFGETTSVLDDTGAVADTFDTSNTVDVDFTVSKGGAATVSDAQVLSGENHAVIGDEIVGVANVTLNSPYNYTFDRLRRGERGSPMAGHSSGEQVVMVTTAAVRVPVAEAYVGSTVKVKCVSKYQTPSDVTAVDVVIAPRTLTDGEEALEGLVRPHFVSPVTVQASTTGTVSWTTFDASGTLPDGAVAAIIQTEWAMNAPDSATLDAYVMLRKDSGEPEYIGARGRAAGAQDDVAGSNQVIVPVNSSREFDYKIDIGFNEGCEINLIGYWSK